MPNKISLQVTIGALPPRGANQNRQEFAEDIASRLLVQLPSTDATFKVSGAIPTSDEGPLFLTGSDSDGNSTMVLYFWSATAAAYRPINLLPVQLRYWVSETQPPSNTQYDIWFKTTVGGKLLSISTYDTDSGTWAETIYNKDEIDAFFDGEVSGKKQVAWGNVTAKPNEATTPTRVTGDAGAVITPVYPWEIVYHTNITKLIVYNSTASRWETLSGGSGQMMFVESAAGTVGSTIDFDNGNYATLLGQWPGWRLSGADAFGRTLVVADPLQTWDGSTAMAVGSQFGATRHTLLATEVPAHTHEVNLRVNTSINGGGAIAASGLMVGDNPAVNVTQPNVPGSSTSSFGGGVSHNNVQPSIARWCLVKL